MGENQESFRDELIKMAQSVEILENTFIGENKIEITISVDENKFFKITNFLNRGFGENKIIISIGKTDFIFLKM